MRLCWFGALSGVREMRQVFQTQGFLRLADHFHCIGDAPKLSLLSILPVARQRQKPLFYDSKSTIWLVALVVPVYIVSRAARNGGKDSTNTNKGEI